MKTSLRTGAALIASIMLGGITMLLPDAVLSQSCPSGQVRKRVCELNPETKKPICFYECVPATVPPPNAGLYPFSATVHSIESFETTGDSLFDPSDEPYVLVFTADLGRPILGGIPFPNKTTLIGPWGGMSGLDYRTATDNNFVWGVFDRLLTPNSLDDIVILVALMENDNANANSVRTAVENYMRANAVTTGLAAIGNKAAIRDNLRQSFDGAIQTVRCFGIRPFSLGCDEQIGSTQIVSITQRQLDELRVSPNRTIYLPRIPFSGENATYVVNLKLRW